MRLFRRGRAAETALPAEPIERFQPTDPSRPWLDSRGLTPVTLYQRYLVERRDWERRAIKAGGIGSGRDGRRLLDDLETLHERLSTPRPISERDASVVQPPPRDPRKVAVVEVAWDGDDLTRITTNEDDFYPGLPSTYRIVVQRVGGEWRLAERSSHNGIPLL